MTALVIPPEVAEYCRKGAEVLRSSERLMQRCWEIWEEPQEPGSEFPWQLCIDHPDAAVLMNNLKKAAEFLEMLGTLGTQKPDDGAGA